MARAPQHLKMRTLFEEGFGVVGGALGTIAGAVFAKFLFVSTLCLGPMGFFIGVFVFATIGGIAMMDLFKKGGGKIYDYGSKINSGKIYYSLEQLIEGL